MSALDLAALKLRAEAAAAADLAQGGWQGGPERNPATLLQLIERLERAERKVERLSSLINSPQTGDFVEAVRVEAAHQKERWPAEHDAGKLDADWLWLVGWLVGKAVHAATQEKRLHHLITAAAALLNWHVDAKRRPVVADVSRIHSDAVGKVVASATAWVDAARDGSYVDGLEQAMFDAVDAARDSKETR